MTENKNKLDDSLLEHEFKKEIEEDTSSTLKVDPLLQTKCGDILLSKTNDLLLYCIFCSESFINLELFSVHLFSNHSFVTGIEKHEEEIMSSEYVSIPVTPTLGEIQNNNQDKKTSSFSIFETVHFSDSDDMCEGIDQNDEDDNYTPSKKIPQTRNREKGKSGSLKKNVISIDKKKQDDLLESIDHSEENKDSKKVEQSILKTQENKKLKIKAEISAQNGIPIGKWQCDICQHICKRGKERKLHEKTHKGVKRLICETCGKGYTSRNRLLDHIRTHTGEKPFKCRFCPKTFFSHSSMKSHDKTHIGFKPFKCDFCDHHFKTKLNKIIHEKKHHQNNENSEELKNQFICKLCGKGFKCNDYLLLHMKRHEEKSANGPPKPFECGYCPSTFISNVNKNAHERLYHKGEYNYKCDFCGKGFLKHNKKLQHEEMHTRVGKQHQCDLCEKKYARPEGLKKHKLKTHNTDSPYKCEICQTGFSSLLQFGEHCMKHNVEEKLYGCEHCGARFDMEIRLERHINKMHRELNAGSINNENENGKLNDAQSKDSNG